MCKVFGAFEEPSRAAEPPWPCRSLQGPPGSSKKPFRKQGHILDSRTNGLAVKIFMLLTQMDLMQFRSETIGVGLGGVAASDGVGWVNVSDGQPQSGHGSTLHTAMRLKGRSNLIMA